MTARLSVCQSQENENQYFDALFNSKLLDMIEMLISEHFRIDIDGEICFNYFCRAQYSRHFAGNTAIWWTLTKQ